MESSVVSGNFIINKILSSKILSEIDNFIATCLYKEGVLIAGKEVTTGLTDKYIGFVDIFNDDLFLFRSNILLSSISKTFFFIKLYHIFRKSSYSILIFNE